MFRYSIEIIGKDADRFLQRMLDAKPNPKMQKFMEESKVYAQKHPIKNYESDEQKIESINKVLKAEEQKPLRDFIKEYLTDE